MAETGTAHRMRLESRVGKPACRAFGPPQGLFSEAEDQASLLEGCGAEYGVISARSGSGERLLFREVRIGSVFTAFGSGMVLGSPKPRRLDRGIVGSPLAAVWKKAEIFQFTHQRRKLLRKEGDWRRDRTKRLGIQGEMNGDYRRRKEKRTLGGK